MEPAIIQAFHFPNGSTRFQNGAHSPSLELKGWPEPRVIVRFWIITSS